MKPIPAVILVLALLLSACSAPPAAPTAAPTAAQPAPSATPAAETEAYAPPEQEALPTIESAYPTPAENEPSDDTGYAAESDPQAAYPAPAAFPDPAAYTWQTVASGFSRPVELTGDRFGRLLVANQAGRIDVVENGERRGEAFLDITGRVGSQENEQGLLGLALHPRYQENGTFYVNYTDRDGDTVIARYTADQQAAVARADSEKILLQVDQPYANHNGGGLAFGPDGFLYIGLGDGGSANDPEGRGQNPDTMLGKLLRIDVDGGDPYAIPADNPFAQGGGSAEIWALGLRNPWRFSFDSLTGDLYIGDVGQNQWEEIDYLPAGSPGGTNFGWNYREGANEFEGVPPAGLELVDPVFQYPHPEGCSVSGGRVYRGSALPEMNGIYIFGDYCTGTVWGLFRAGDGSWQNQVLFTGGLTPSAFGVDDAGELYLVEHNNGVVLKLARK
jgi:glucose/arabinose dehydrogenase